jgi:hypothetical protein
LAFQTVSTGVSIQIDQKPSNSLLLDCIAQDGASHAVSTAAARSKFKARDADNLDTRGAADRKDKMPIF